MIDTYFKPLFGEYVDYSNPICTGLLGAWLCNEGVGNRLVNLIRPGVDFKTSSMGNDIWSPAVGGVSLKRASNSTNLWQTEIPFNIGSITEATFMVRGAFAAPPAFSGMLMMRGSGTDVMGMTASSDGTRLGYVWNADVNTYGWNSGPLIVLATGLATYAIVVRPGSATAYLNGTVKVTNSVSHASHVTSTVFTLAADSFNTSTRNCAGIFDSAFFWRRALTDEEIFSMYILPYQILLPYSVGYFSPAAEPSRSTDIFGFPDLTGPIYSYV